MTTCRWSFLIPWLVLKLIILLLLVSLMGTFRFFLLERLFDILSCFRFDSILLWLWFFPGFQFILFVFNLIHEIFIPLIGWLFSMFLFFWNSTILDFFYYFILFLDPCHSRLFCFFVHNDLLFDDWLFFYLYFWFLNYFLDLWFVHNNTFRFRNFLYDISNFLFFLFLFIWILFTSFVIYFNYQFLWAFFW